ncbi:MAG TPA: NAD-dependent epimerase/dehydratase family protein, partial [Roseomonas sp.]
MSGNWRGRRVLVTGGAGFLGSALCHALGAAGAEVTALDALLPGTGARRANLAGSGARLVEDDLRDADLLPLVEGIDTLFNMAGQTSHAGSQADPFTDLAINGHAQLRLIAALRQGAPGARVVHASTRQLYGRPQMLPVPETHPIMPPDANGVSKFAAEQYWLLENRVHGRPVAALRLTNCYGPRMRVMDARQTFLGIWVRRVLEGQPFEVWGGEQLRDFSYVDDVVA